MNSKWLPVRPVVVAGKFALGLSSAALMLACGSGDAGEGAADPEYEASNTLPVALT